MFNLTDFISKLNISRFRGQDGQTMSEYAVILGLIVLVTVATFTALGDSVDGAINSVRAIFP